MWRMFDATRNRPPFIIDETKQNNQWTTGDGAAFGDGGKKQV